MLVPGDRYSQLNLDDGDYDIYSGMAEDDYVLVTVDTANDVTKITKLELKKDILTSFRGCNSDKFCIGGTWYSDAAGTFAFNTVDLDEEYEFIAYNGYIFYIDGTKAVDASDFVLVQGAEAAPGALNTYAQAKVLYSDGTVGTIDVDANYTAMVGTLVYYEESATSDVYTFTALAGPMTLTPLPMRYLDQATSSKDAMIAPTTSLMMQSSSSRTPLPASTKSSPVLN
jgi:hypothetical protein